ncbi:MAG: hypothetical protein H0X04_06190, partial [Chthoniobacterales bacterium]|nr:hypothetical protein [Chthoniobacterales bacterium]
MRENRQRFYWLIIIFVLTTLPQVAYAQKSVAAGKASVAQKQLRPGQTIELAGEWLYKPGYLLQANEQPQLAEKLGGYVAVPVPQLLNRTQWWLDDSEDFKSYEAARLKNFGFDTERAEDGWYQLSLDVPALPKHRRVFIEFEGVAMKSKAFCNGQ